MQEVMQAAGKILERQRDRITPHLSALSDLFAGHSVLVHHDVFIEMMSAIRGQMKRGSLDQHFAVVTFEEGNEPKTPKGTPFAEFLEQQKKAKKPQMLVVKNIENVDEPYTTDLLAFSNNRPTVFVSSSATKQEAEASRRNIELIAKLAGYTHGFAVRRTK